MKKYSLLVSALIATPTFAAIPATWTTTIDAATYASSGTIIFNDHGYTGPTGVGANDFQVGSGFDASRIGQIQHVVTKDPDLKTPDVPGNIIGDFLGPKPYPNANMDGQVNFFAWGYTTGAGSTFNNMQIDKAGNYHIAKNDMAFRYYDQFKYAVGNTLMETRDTQLNFQPFALSDARGWCGSVLTSDPAALERMAGQVTFDFAFDVYFDGNHSGGTAPDSFSSREIVPGFVMRSYGDYQVNVTTSGGLLQSFSGSAVENNTNPETGLLDANWQNQVSFLGAGVIPKGVWVLNEGTADVQVVAAGTPGATWHANAFGGYAFLMRADATRTLDFVDPAGFSDYASPAPEPETYAMMLAGLGLVGAVARRRSQRV